MVRRVEPGSPGIITTSHHFLLSNSTQFSTCYRKEGSCIQPIINIGKFVWWLLVMLFRNLFCPIFSSVIEKLLNNVYMKGHDYSFTCLSCCHSIMIHDYKPLYFPSVGPALDFLQPKFRKVIALTINNTAIHFHYKWPCYPFFLVWGRKSLRSIVFLSHWYKCLYTESKIITAVILIIHIASRHEFLYYSTVANGRRGGGDEWEKERK